MSRIRITLRGCITFVLASSLAACMPAYRWSYGDAFDQRPDRQVIVVVAPHSYTAERAAEIAVGSVIAAPGLILVAPWILAGAVGSAAQGAEMRDRRAELLEGHPDWQVRVQGVMAKKQILDRLRADLQEQLSPGVVVQQTRFSSLDEARDQLAHKPLKDATVIAITGVKVKLDWVKAFVYMELQLTADLTVLKGDGSLVVAKTEAVGRREAWALRNDKATTSESCHVGLPADWFAENYAKVDACIEALMAIFTAYQVAKLRDKPYRPVDVIKKGGRVMTAQELREELIGATLSRAGMQKLELKLEAAEAMFTSPNNSGIRGTWNINKENQICMQFAVKQCRWFWKAGAEYFTTEAEPNFHASAQLADCIAGIRTCDIDVGLYKFDVRKLPDDVRPKADDAAQDLINCVSGGTRQWTRRSQCD
jgi:hypothetical protein